MTAPLEAYDEPGTRTRLAWLRTVLVLAAVSALVMRGLYLREAPWPTVAAVVVLVLAFSGIAWRRVRQVGPHESPGMSRGVAYAVLAVLSCGVLLAALALAWS